MTQVEVIYNQGMKGEPKRRVFKTEAAFERWFQKNEANVSNVMCRQIEESK